MHSNADSRPVAALIRSVRQLAPLHSFLKSPESLATSEYILVVLRDYNKGSFESGIWERGDGEYSSNTNKVQYDAIVQLHAFSHYCMTARILFERNCSCEAGQALSAAMANIKNIMFAEHPKTLSEIFNSCYHLLVHGRGEITLVILRQISAMGQIVLGERHPLSLICRWLYSLYQRGSHCFNDAITVFLQAVADSFESALGPLHATILTARLDFIDMTCRNKDSSLELFPTVNPYQKLLCECESSLGGSDPRTQFVRQGLANYLFDTGKSAQGIEITQSILNDADNMRWDYDRHRYKEIGFYEMAWGLYSLGQIEAAITNMRKALESAISQQHYSDGSRCLSIQVTVELEDWLEERGELESAAEVHELMTALCEPLEKFLL